MKTADFDYHLPPELIAQHPPPDRTDARLMIVHRATGDLEHRRVTELPELLRSGDLLVINDTRVIPARVFGHKRTTGGQVEALLIEERADLPTQAPSGSFNSLINNFPPQATSWPGADRPPLTDNLCSRGRPIPPERFDERGWSRFLETKTDISDVGYSKSRPAAGVSLQPAHSSVWEVLLKASRPPAPGSVLDLASDRIRAEVLALLGNGRALVRLTYDRPLMDILDQEGVAPLPPYIKRPQAGDTASQSALDRERYQTVYARTAGAIAAPTAGLHFTPELLERLAGRGIERTAVTLHVGLGTFKPVTTDTVEAHTVEPERYRVSPETARRITETQHRQGRLVAVGSTVVRTLETVASEQGAVKAMEGRSGLFIYPPYSFRVVGALLTNFHLPASTLLMMVSAFAGQKLIRHAYATAIRKRYRFYSYGDCMLIL